MPFTQPQQGIKLRMATVHIIMHSLPKYFNLLPTTSGGSCTKSPPTLAYYNQYTRGNCLNECRLNDTIKRHGCVGPTVYPFQSDKPLVGPKCEKPIHFDDVLRLVLEV